jgi:hypothetical protein
VQVQPFVPRPFEKDSLFGVSAKELFGHERLAGFVFSLKDAHLIEQRDKIMIMTHRRRQIMGAPWIGNYV